MRFEHAHAQAIVQRLQMPLQGWAQSRTGSRLSRSWLFLLVVSFISYPGNRGTKNIYFAIGKLKSLFSGFFNRTRDPETNFTFGFLNENLSLQRIRTDSWTRAISLRQSPQFISYQDLGTRLAPSPTNVLVGRSGNTVGGKTTQHIPARVGLIFSGPGSVKFAVPNFKIKTVRTDPYSRKSNRKNKEIKQK